MPAHDFWRALAKHARRTIHGLGPETFELRTYFVYGDFLNGKRLGICLWRATANGHFTLQGDGSDDAAGGGQGARDANLAEDGGHEFVGPQDPEQDFSVIGLRDGDGAECGHDFPGGRCGGGIEKKIDVFLSKKRGYEEQCGAAIERFDGEPARGGGGEGSVLEFAEERDVAEETDNLSCGFEPPADTRGAAIAKGRTVSP